MILCETQDQWEHEITSAISNALQAAIKLRGKASLVVSGGSTPKPIYELLSQEDLDWKNVHIALADERWVEPDHPASNEKLIRETLLKNKAKAASFIPMKTAHTSPQEAVTFVNEAYKTLSFPFDVVLLGMGPDGHTASLFPHAASLSLALNTEDIVAPIKAQKSGVTGVHLDRMTLTGPSIATTRTIILALKGQEKKKAYNQANICQDAHEMPVSLFLKADNFNAYWTPS